MYIFGNEISEPVYFRHHYLDMYILGNEKLLDVIWGRGLGLVTHTGSLALRARACTRLRRDMQMCSVGAIEKAGASVRFWDPLNP
jgi:hypothetical protein